jgi:hypothetical protein
MQEHLPGSLEQTRSGVSRKTSRCLQSDRIAIMPAIAILLTIIRSRRNLSSPAGMERDGPD